jgi:triosephosphate isomerase
MNGSNAANTLLIEGVLQGVQGLQNVEVAVCPPFVYLSNVASQIKGSRIRLGGQNLSEQSGGAFTGEISAAMLSDVGCQYVIVGHSERRSLYAESDALVADKFSVVLKNDLTPILCVGESLEERESGQTETVVAKQLNAVLEKYGVDGFVTGVIAYEPVWAIGTGKTATPEQAQAVHAFIRQTLAGYDAKIAEGVRILYGGSVKAASAGELFKMADIDGGLIGGAALDAAEFLAICQQAE